LNDGGYFNVSVEKYSNFWVHLAGGSTGTVQLTAVRW